MWTLFVVFESWIRSCQRLQWRTSFSFSLGVPQNSLFCNGHHSHWTFLGHMLQSNEMECSRQAALKYALLFYSSVIRCCQLTQRKYKLSYVTLYWRVPMNVDIVVLNCLKILWKLSLCHCLLINLSIDHNSQRSQVSWITLYC